MVIERPHEAQNSAPSWSAAPHWGQVTRHRMIPHRARRRRCLLIAQPMRALAALLVVLPVAAHAVEDDPTFGPLIEIERIDVVGASTDAEIIRREVLVKPGDRLRT